MEDSTTLAQQLLEIARDGLWVALKNMLKQAARDDVNVAVAGRWTLSSASAAQLGREQLFYAILDRFDYYATRLGHEGVTLRTERGPTMREPLLLFSWGHQ